MRLENLPLHLFPETWAALERGVREGVAPGFVLGIWRASDPGCGWVGAVGKQRVFPPAPPEAPSPAMSAETVFDLSSVSKVMGTATLLGRVVDRGWMRFEDPLRAFLPEYPDRQIRLSHLLSHTSGLPAWIPLWQKIRERAAGEGAPSAPDGGATAAALARVPIARRQRWAREVVSATPRERPIGASAVYSDLSFLLLGFALEEVLGQSLDRAVRSWVWEPMGIRSAFYRRIPGPCPVSLERIAPTENCPWRNRVLLGEVHDDNAWAMGGYAGHAGAFGDVQALLTFARALMTGGFLTRETRQAMWTRVPGFDRTLGWDTPSGAEPSASRLFSAESVGHLGFTGTSIWIDPTVGLAVALLSNRVHPTRGPVIGAQRGPGDPPPKIRAFRPALHAAVRRDLAV